MSKMNDKQMTTLKKLLSYIKKYTPLIILSLIFAAVSSILTLYVPILTGRAVDCIVSAGNG